MTQHTTDLERRRWRRPAAALAAVVAIAVPTAVAANGAERETPPAPDEVTVLGYHANNKLAYTAPLGRAYGPVGSELGVIVGGSIDDVCSGVTPPDTLLTASQRGDGSWDVRVPFGGVYRETFVYAIQPDEGIFDFFGRACGAIAGGGAAPEPLVSGEIVLSDRVWDLASPYSSDAGPQPAGRYQNSVNGEVTDADGNRFRLITKANYRVLEDGPPEFKTHTVDLKPLG